MSCVWADRIRWRGIGWDIIRGIGWEEGEGRNNGGIGNWARASASRREEVDMRAGRGGGDRGRMKRPSLLSIPSDVTQCQFSNVLFYLF